MVILILITNINFLFSTKIEIKGRQLYVNDRPFTIKGVCYYPVPVGKTVYTYKWDEDPSMYNTDFPMIKQMGANCIRTYYDLTIEDAMDAAYKNGLYVIMEYFVIWNTNYSDTTVKTQVLNGVKRMVDRWKDHPALLMWCIGHEVNFNIHLKNGELVQDAIATNRLQTWYTFLNEIAGKIHEWESPYWHPVTYGEGVADATNFGIWRDIYGRSGADTVGNTVFHSDDANMTNFDIWGVQTYQGKGFNVNFFETYASLSSKPLWIAETGCDAWDAINNIEEQNKQAEYIEAQWKQIEENLSAKKADNVCVGVTFFSWSDGWWKYKFGDNLTHNTNGSWANPYYYDYQVTASGTNRNMNEEWWGVVSIFPDTYQKTPRKAYYTLQSLWIKGDDEENQLNNILFRKESVNVPNPFVIGQDDYTDIWVYLNYSSVVKAVIYDYSGKLIRTLDNPIEYPGYIYQLRWDGKDENNNEVMTGLYLCKITAEYKIKDSSQQETQIIKIAVLK